MSGRGVEIAQRSLLTQSGHHVRWQIAEIGPAENGWGAPHLPSASISAELEPLSGTGRRLVVMPSALYQLKRMA